MNPQQLLTDTVTKAGFELGGTNGYPNHRRYALPSSPPNPHNEFLICVKPKHSPRWGTWHTVVVTQYWVRAYLYPSKGWEPRTEQIRYGTINELMGHLHRLVNEKFSAWDWM
jgi:hypothetical protein